MKCQVFKKLHFKHLPPWGGSQEFGVGKGRGSCTKKIFARNCVKYLRSAPKKCEWIFHPLAVGVSFKENVLLGVK